MCHDVHTLVKVVVGTPNSLEKIGTFFSGWGFTWGDQKFPVGFYKLLFWEEATGAESPTRRRRPVTDSHKNLIDRTSL